MQKIKRSFLLVFVAGLFLSFNVLYAQNSSVREVYQKALVSLKSVQDNYKAALTEYRSSDQSNQLQITFIEKTTPFLKQGNEVITLDINILEEAVKNDLYLSQNYKDETNTTIQKYKDSLLVQKEGIVRVNTLPDLQYYLIEMQNFRIQLLTDTRIISARILVERSKAGKKKVEDLLSQVKKRSSELSKTNISEITKGESEINKNLALSQQNIEASESAFEKMQVWENADPLHNQIRNLTNEANRNIIESLGKLENMLNVLK